MNRKTSLPDAEAERRTAQLLREAEEALSQERFIAFWQRNGKTLIGMALMLVVGTSAGTVWRHFATGKSAKATASLLQAADPMQGAAQPDLAKLQPEFAKLGKEHQAVGALLLANIASMAEKQDTQQLQSLLGQNTQPQKPVWAWLQAWAAQRMLLDDPKADAKDLEAKMLALAATQKGTAFEALALIDAALLQGERLQDPTAALAHLKQAAEAAKDAPALLNLVTELQHVYDVVVLTTTEKK